MCHQQSMAAACALSGRGRGYTPEGGGSSLYFDITNYSVSVLRSEAMVQNTSSKRPRRAYSQHDVLRAVGQILELLNEKADGGLGCCDHLGFKTKDCVSTLDIVCASTIAQVHKAPIPASPPASPDGPASRGSPQPLSPVHRRRRSPHPLLVLRARLALPAPPSESSSTQPRLRLHKLDLSARVLDSWPAAFPLRFVTTLALVARPAAVQRLPPCLFASLPFVERLTVRCSVAPALLPPGSEDPPAPELPSELLPRLPNLARLSSRLGQLDCVLCMPWPLAAAAAGAPPVLAVPPMPKLTSLRLAACDLSAAPKEFLDGSTALRSLWLVHCGLRAVPRGLERLQGLGQVDMRGNPFDGGFAPAPLQLGSRWLGPALKALVDSKGCVVPPWD